MLEQQKEKVRPIENGVSKAMQEEKTGELYIKGDAQLIDAKTKLLHKALVTVTSTSTAASPLTGTN